MSRNSCGREKNGNKEPAEGGFAMLDIVVEKFGERWLRSI
jgi:hypothetical protein